MFIYTVQDFISLVLIVLFFLVFFIFSLLLFIKQSRCRHAEIFENGSCDAICISCGKNLGFIGTWKKNHPNEVFK